jgi:hypothetical protein
MNGAVHETARCSLKRLETFGLAHGLPLFTAGSQRDSTDFYFAILTGSGPLANLACSSMVRFSALISNRSRLKTLI